MATLLLAQITATVSILNLLICAKEVQVRRKGASSDA
jgi:hypothetical protein